MSWKSDIREDQRLFGWLGGAKLAEYPEREWRKYESTKAREWQNLRKQIARAAGETVADQFQAPSYKHSLWSEAGNRTGKVLGNINDYTRDRHPMANELEKNLEREYLTLVRRQLAGALVTSSGMAALATIWLGLQRAGKLSGTVLIGKESYFQNQEVVTTAATKVIRFDELDMDQLAKLLRNENPTVILVDSLCNNPTLTCPDIIKIAKAIRENSKRKVVLVVDNSLLGMGVGYERLWRENRGKCQIVVWESLNKFFQFGLDRTTGGVIWADKNGEDGLTYWDLFHARIHAGAIMPDFACALMPRQSAARMEVYQERINRNAEIIATELKKIVGGRVKQVYRAEREPFAGAQIVVLLTNNSVWQIQSVIRRAITEAKRRRVQLSAGSSFGLPNTRVYLTARKTDFARSFLRISAGCESEPAIREIGEVLKKVLA